MEMLFSRRQMLASLGAACAAHGAGNSHVRAGCLLTPESFEPLLDSMKEMQGLGYTGYSTNLRLLQAQYGRVEEARGQLAETGLDLIGVRALLPKHGELGTERALEDLGRQAMAARQFGARTLMVHSAGLAADGKFKPEDLEAKAKFFDECAKRCKEMGVIFVYRTQEAEFQNEAAEVLGLMAKTDYHITYFNLDLGRAVRVYPEAVTVFREHPSRTFAMEASFGEFKPGELAAAVKHTKWISWMIDAAPGTDSRGIMKKAFGV